MKSWTKSVTSLIAYFGCALLLGAVEPLVFGTRDIGYVGSGNANEVISAPVLLEGPMRKIGAAETTLSLSKVSSVGGSISIFDGKLNLTEDGTRELIDVPQSLLETAAFWVDASTNVVAYSSNSVNWVTQWLDVREPDLNPPYQFKRAVSQLNITNLYPTFVENSAGVSNQFPYVWFGGYGKGRWMSWLDTDSVGRSINNIYNVFIVHGC